MTKNHLLLSLLFVVLLPAIRAEQYTVAYDVVAYFDAASGFSRQSKIFIQVDGNCPAAHRDEVARVAEIARKQGLNCVPKEEADFKLLVSFNSGPEKHLEHYTIFGIWGAVFPLLDHGTKRSSRSVWEGIVDGKKGSAQDWFKALPPPYVEVDQVVGKLVDSIGREIADRRASAGIIGGAGPGSAPKDDVDNPPTEFIKNAPTTGDFNRIARKFFESDLIDFAQAKGTPAFVQGLRGLTANELYQRLKLREKEFHGAIDVSGLSIGGENFVVVQVRIAQQKGATKWLYTRYLHIRFSAGDMLRGVERGMYMKQEF